MAADLEKAASAEHQGLQGVDQNPPVLSIGDPASDHDLQGAGTLQLLPRHREHGIAMDILPGGSETALQVVESKESKA